jgi:hypothetical protein
MDYNLIFWVTEPIGNYGGPGKPVKSKKWKIWKEELISNEPY